MADNSVPTHFAPPERAALEWLRSTVELASRNAVIDTVLKTTGALLAVLNAQRQILVVNDSILGLLGITNAEALLGLRPGEVLDCVHAHEMPGGCGTAEMCASCGAAIAIVTALAGTQPVERTCAMQVRQHGRVADLYFGVRAVPVEIEGHKLLLLFLQDITQQQEWALMQRVFYHDLNNQLTALLGNAQLLAMEPPRGEDDLAGKIAELACHMAREIAGQQALLQSDLSRYPTVFKEIAVTDLFGHLQSVFKNHPATELKTLDFSAVDTACRLYSDLTVLLRVLTNMLINALEATPPGGRVRAWCEERDGQLAFCVWNAQMIPPALAPRIFSRNFSTKANMGRGLGTYAMKQFGEQVLGGRVSFTTTEAEGTAFRLHVPKAPAVARRPTAPR